MSMRSEGAVTINDTNDHERYGKSFEGHATSRCRPRLACDKKVVLSGESKPSFT